LPVAEPIVGATSITQSYEEIPVRPEGEHPPVVVTCRLGREEDQPGGLRIGQVGIAADLILDNFRIAVPVAVVDVEKAVGWIQRVKSQSEQALFSVVANQFADIQKRL
jgi:hypothetical protein